MIRQTKWYREGFKEGFEIGKLESAKENLIISISLKTNYSIPNLSKEFETQLNSLTLDNQMAVFKAVSSIESSNLEDFKRAIDTFL